MVRGEEGSMVRGWAWAPTELPRPPSQTPRPCASLGQQLPSPPLGITQRCNRFSHLGPEGGGGPVHTPRCNYSNRLCPSPPETLPWLSGAAHSFILKGQGMRVKEGALNNQARTTGLVKAGLPRTSRHRDHPTREGSGPLSLRGSCTLATPAFFSIPSPQP